VGGTGSNLQCVVRACSNVFKKIMWVGAGVIYSVQCVLVQMFLTKLCGWERE
jgi:hypothetical protein